MLGKLLKSSSEGEQNVPLKSLTTAGVNIHGMSISGSALGPALGFLTSNGTFYIGQNIAFAMGHFMVLSVISRKIILLLQHI